MAPGYTDRKALLALLVVALIGGGIILYWYGQAVRMRTDFREALREGRVGALPPTLRDKTWTEEELRSVEVLTLDRDAGYQRALLRWLYAGGDVVISESQYAFQAKITDLGSGIRYVFGLRRTGSGGWEWAAVDPASMHLYIEQRAAEKPL